MNRVLRWCGLVGGGVGLVLAGLVFAGPGQQVDVRVLDVDTGELLATERVTVQSRLAFEREGRDRQYLGFRRDQFRGQQVLAISLTSEPEEWNHHSYTSWHQPSEIEIGTGAYLELTPVGWADRFCRALAAIDEPAVRDTSLGLTVGGEMMVNQPGWDGREEVPMIRISERDRETGWHVGVDEDQLLYLRIPDYDEPFPVDTVRPDFPMSRSLAAGDKSLDLFYTPSGYSQRFCERYEVRGEAYAGTIADHFFGRD